MNKPDQICAWIDTLPEGYAIKICLDILCYLNIDKEGDVTCRTPVKNWIKAPGREDGFAAAFLISMELDQTGRKEIMDEYLDKVETTPDKNLKNAINSCISNLQPWQECYLSWQELRKDLFRWEYKRQT